MKTLNIILHYLGFELFATKANSFYLCRPTLLNAFGLDRSRVRVRLKATRRPHPGSRKVTYNGYKFEVTGNEHQHYVVPNTLANLEEATGLKLKDGTTFYVSVK